MSGSRQTVRQSHDMSGCCGLSNVSTLEAACLGKESTHCGLAPLRSGWGSSRRAACPVKPLLAARQAIVSFSDSYTFKFHHRTCSNEHINQTRTQVGMPGATGTASLPNFVLGFVFSYSPI